MAFISARLLIPRRESRMRKRELASHAIPDAGRSENKIRRKQSVRRLVQCSTRIWQLDVKRPLELL